MTHKKFALIFAATAYTLSFLGAFAFVALLWAYDPFWFFHKPIFREMTFITDKRVSTRGMIDFMDFDGVILGSSIMQNTQASEAESLLGGKWLNLAFESGAFSERTIVLNRILKHKPKALKSVIYTIEGYYLLNDTQDVKNEKNKDRLYSSPLWRENFGFFRKMNYYLNEHFIKCALKWNLKPECVGEKDINYAIWYNGYKNNGFGGYPKWNDGTKQDLADKLKRVQNRDFIDTPFEIEQRREFVRENVLKFVEQNPQITFHFIIPVQSRLHYRVANWGEKRSPEHYLKAYISQLKWFVNELSRFKNAKIYGFDNTAYPDDMGNYVDVEHYDAPLNSLYAKAIAANTHRINAKNIDIYLAKMQEKIAAYDLTPLINDIKSWEKEKSTREKNEKHEKHKKR